MEAQKDITLYWSLPSQPARAVKALFLIGNIPHEDKHLDLLKGETRTEEYAAINPRKHVPFIVEGDFKLGESNAILKYLCDTRDSVPETLWPKDPKKRAIVDQYLEWQQYHFRPALLTPVRFGIMRVTTGKEIPEEVT